MLPRHAGPATNFTYYLDCLVTVTTPFSSTTQRVCVTGTGAIMPTPGVYVTFSALPCP